MSILIKGMEMPKNCYHCWLGHKCPKYESLLWNEIGKERKADCPLVPVPPHGRLIDADALRKEVKKHATPSDAWVFSLIRTAPTIIEAEEGEA